VIVRADGAIDIFGRMRAELFRIKIGEKRGCVMDLDTYDSDSKPAKKKKNNKKKATKKKAGE
jgi:hypothetical protein